jgi:hypothetical protein
VRFTSQTDFAAIRAAGIYAIQDGPGGTNTGAETVGFHVEEPSSWADIGAQVNSFKPLASRFLHLSATWNQFVYGGYSGTPAPGGMNAVMSSPISTSIGNVHLNLPSDDIYWFASSATSFGQQYPGGRIYNNGTALTVDQMARGDHYGDMVDMMRGWVTTYPAPVCAPYIESEDGLVGAGSRRILPQEFNWAAWSTLVHGARCLMYFGTTSNFGSASTFGFGTSILPGASVSMATQATATNGMVANLARILNAPFAVSYATVTPSGYRFPTQNLSLANGIDIMSKWYTDGPYTNSTGSFDNGFYIFTTVRGSEAQSNISATFTLAGAPSKSGVPVVGEGRTVNIVNGQFTDTFANAYAVHIYGPISYP